MKKDLNTHCKRCGAKLISGFKFCEICGLKIEDKDKQNKTKQQNNYQFLYWN